MGGAGESRRWGNRKKSRLFDALNTAQASLRPRGLGFTIQSFAPGWAPNFFFFFLSTLRGECIIYNNIVVRATSEGHIVSRWPSRLLPL